MINNDFYKRLKYFSNSIQYSGASLKRFARVDDNTPEFQKQIKKNKNFWSEKQIKDSYFFAELFNQLKSGKSSYKTYFNELIDPQYTDTAYYPRSVNCLIKYTEPIFAYSEIVGSRLANELGIDTVYNEEVVGSFDSQKAIMSVDFVPKDMNIDSLIMLGIDFSEDDDLERCLDLLDKHLPLILIDECISVPDQSQAIAKFKEDFVRQYLFRNLFCDDMDFDSKNIGMMYNKDSFCVAPSFDMEMMFEGKLGGFYIDFVLRNVSFVRRAYPQIWNEFISRLEKTLNSGRIEEIMYNSVSFMPKRYCDKYHKIIKNNAKFLLTLSKWNNNENGLVPPIDSDFDFEFFNN
ncbi:MAG: hypothetical protein IJW59_01665 [Clostridia bacterium]|nr:hypothetical protein [Clostridia bacterium]